MRRQAVARQVRVRPAEPELQVGARLPRAASTLLGAGSVATLLGVVAVAASVQGTARFEPPDVAFAPVPAPTRTAAPATIAPLPPGEVTSNDTAGRIVLIVLVVLAVAVVGFLGYLLVRAIVRAWRARLPERAAAAPSDENFVLDADPDPAAAAPTIRRGIADALRAIDDDPDVSDAIIAAWIGLEDSAADAGMRRGQSETPAEFTLRIIIGAHGIERDAKALLRLYERVRFSGHTATQRDRVDARHALAAIDEAWR